MTTSGRVLLPLAVVLALGVAACGAGSNDASGRATDALTVPSTTSTPTTTTVPEDTSCDPTASYEPLATVPTAAEASAADSFMRGRLAEGPPLVVAVDENTQGLASRDPQDAQLKGLEIELAELLAQRLFGGELGEHVRFKTVTTKEKIEFAKEGEVDLSISAISMTCERWKDVAFSSEYLQAVHAFLVRSDSSIHSPVDASGKRVCMTKGSTSIRVLDTRNEEFRRSGQPQARPVLVDARTDCLVDLQEGTVDAYLGHDTFLVGMVDQDPSLRIVDEGSPQHYGIAIGKDHGYFVQYVNAVLAELRQNNTLQALADDSLQRLFENAGLPQKRVPTPERTRPRP